MKTTLAIAILAVVACAVACAPAPDTDTPPEPSGAGALTGDQQQDWAAIERVEDEARQLAVATGCNTADDCRAAPVGNRACGGPRYYLVYCATSTDSAALSAQLDEIVRAENEYNQRYEVISTCEFRMPPEIAFSGGECRPLSG
jgi:hypothetical protein